MKIFKYAPLAVALSGSLVATTAHADKWGLGVGAAVMPSPYKDYDDKVLPVPLLTYQGERFFWNGLGGGYYLLKNETHLFSLNAYYMGLQFDPSDSDDPKMKQLGKRHATLMAGINYTYNADWGMIRSELSADTLGKSNGVLGDLAYLHRFSSGKATITPGIGVLWSNGKHNNYYYGVSRREAVRSGVSHYNANSTVSPYLELSATYDVTEKWNAFFNGRVTYLGSNIKDSPMVDQSYSPMLITGMMYEF